MKRRRKLELLLGDIRSLLADPARAAKDDALVHAVWDITFFADELSGNAAEMRAVLEAACLLRVSNCLGRQVAEERLMGNLQRVAWHCRCRLEDAKLARFPDFSFMAQVPPGLQPTCEVLRELRDFALGCFEFRRPRDSFGGRRRAMAFDMLAEIGRRFDLPEVVSLAREALRKAQSVESRQAAEFLQVYFTERGLPPDEQMTEELLSLAERADSRSTVFNALNALVETGTISEFEALDRMDDWKSKHR